MTTRSLIDLFLQNLFVSGAVLNRSGRIIEVSEGWKQFARSGQLGLEDYAVGQDYLKHAVFPDTSSVETLRGLKGLLSRDIDVFSTIYPCDTPTEPKWFLLVGLAIDNGSAAAAAVLHVDISSFVRNRSNVSAAMIGVGPAALDPAIEKLTRAVRQTIAASLQNRGSRNLNSGDAREHKVIHSLTAHQLSLLTHLARGASNAEIAQARHISVGTAKNQAAALLRKLGVANRTQAALMAIRNGLLDEAG